MRHSNKLTCALAIASAIALPGMVNGNTLLETSGGGGGGGGPDCSHATATAGVLWPPDHTMVSVGIMDVLDDLPVTITVNSIQQDEPVDATGSGNTAPDGVILAPATGPGVALGAPAAQVRAERAGPGTGRIYLISYNAVDTAGMSCTGQAPIQVIVPHDQGQGYTPIDTGNWYDSTATS